MISFYPHTKTPIGFWYRQGLNPKSIIQLQKTLPVELIGTHLSCEVKFIKPNMWTEVSVGHNFM